MECKHGSGHCQCFLNPVSNAMGSGRVVGGGDVAVSGQLRKLARNRGDRQDAMAGMTVLDANWLA